MLTAVAAAGIALMQSTASADDETMIRHVLSGLGADRADVRACLTEQVASSPDRAAEVGRLGDVLAWIEQAVSAPRRTGGVNAIAGAQQRSDAFVDIVATFIHERRLDDARLAVVSDGRLTPRHISTYARVQRALGAGHDAKLVLCGLKEPT